MQGRTMTTVARVALRPLREEVEAWVDVMLTAFEGWMLMQPEGLEWQSAYMTVLMALEEHERVSSVEASAAAAVLANAAMRGPYADELACLFDGLAEAWRLSGSGMGGLG